MSLLYKLFLFVSSLTPIAISSPPWASVPLYVPSFPSAVRSPCLNTWRPQRTGDTLSNTTAFSWSNQFQYNWFVMVRIDGIAYKVQGGQLLLANVTANQTKLEFTPTRAAVTLQAGPVNATITFLNPITPRDLVRQSIPFTYLSLDIESTDNNVHDIQVYSDIDYTWVTADNSQTVNWIVSTDSEALVLNFQVENLQPFVTFNNHLQDGSVYYSMLKQERQSWQIGKEFQMRDTFNQTGVLNNAVNQDFTSPSASLPAFAISVDIGNVIRTSESIVWAVGIIRDPVVNTVTSSGTPDLRRSYFWANYTSDIEVVEFFLSDYPNALTISKEFDSQLQAAANQISSQYADLILLSVVQTFGTLDITVGLDSSGKLNASDIKVYMNVVDPLNSVAQVNVVDVIFSAAPIFITLNPDFLKYLLLPLLETPLQTSTYAIHDIGESYPNATHVSDVSASLGIEESANMLILILAHLQATNDTSLIAEYYLILTEWTNYLIASSLQPGSQTTSDALPVENQSNLALKGIIGIRAMSAIDKYMNNTDSSYLTVAEDLLNQWYTQAVSADGHITSSYGDASSWALIYNMYVDKLLKLNFINDTLYETQTQYYKQHLANGSTIYGIPFDSSQPLLTRTDWLMLTAATATDNATRDQFITSIHNYATSLQQYTPFTLQYNPTTGTSNQKGNMGINSPAQGSMFALLALMPSSVIVLPATAPTVTKTLASTSTAGNETSPVVPSTGSIDIGAIVGGVLGGLGAIGVGVGLFILVRRRKHQLEGRDRTIHTQATAASSFSLPFLHSDSDYSPINGSSGLSVRANNSDRSTVSLAMSYGNTRSELSGSTLNMSSNMSTLGDAHSPSLGPIRNTPATEGVRPISLPRSQEVNPNSTRDSEAEVMAAKQILINEEMRTRMRNLWRQLETLRTTGRNAAMIDTNVMGPPPAYE